MEILAECTTCRQPLPLESFPPNRSLKNGRQPKCRPCYTAYMQAYERTRPGRHRTTNRQRLTKTTPEKEHANQILRKYQISAKDYAVMLAGQGGVCKICQLPESTVDKTGKARRLCIDHDHACCPGKITCGKCIRGLLCIRCNAALGHFRDDPKNLVAAIAYLESSSPQVNRAI